jgi:hypothetical protein
MCGAFNCNGAAPLANAAMIDCRKIYERKARIDYDKETSK